MTIEQIIDRIQIMNKYHLLATQYSEMWKAIYCKADLYGNHTSHIQAMETENDNTH